jgi:methionine-rich copper-binding protein CopC
VTGVRRRLVSVAAATALLGGATVPAVIMAPVAAAHSVLLSISPENGAEVENSPEEIVLAFNEEINPNFVTVAVIAEADSANRVAGEPTVDGATVTVGVPDLTPGSYTVGYRVTSADGHVIDGKSTFRVIGSDAEADATQATGAPDAGAESVTAQGQGASGSQGLDATQSQDGAARAADADSSESSSVNPVIWVVGGLAVALIAGAFFLLRRGGD